MTDSVTTHGTPEVKNVENIFERDVIVEKLKEVEKWLKHLRDAQQEKFDRWWEMVRPSYCEIEEASKSLETRDTQERIEKMYIRFYEVEKIKQLDGVLREEEKSKLSFRAKHQIIYYLTGFLFYKKPNVEVGPICTIIDEVAEALAKELSFKNEFFDVKCSISPTKYHAMLDYCNTIYTVIDIHNRPCVVSFQHTYNNKEIVEQRQPHELTNRLDKIKRSIALIHPESSLVTVDAKTMFELRCYDRFVEQANKQTSDTE